MQYEDILKYKNARVHVVGVAGTECAGMLRLLARLGFRSLIAHDFHAERDFRSGFMRAHAGLDRDTRRRILSEVMGVSAVWHQGEEYLSGVGTAQLVVVPQSWRLYQQNAPLMSLHRAGVPFLTLTQAFSSLFRGRIVGVTGTKGKSTTASMIDAILRSSEVRHAYSGNDRRAVQSIEALLNPEVADVLLLEVSNRQLVDATVCPDIGVLTNVLEDHIDEHGSLECYAGVKASMFRCQTPHDVAVLNWDDDQSRRIAGMVSSQVRFYSVSEELPSGACLCGDRLVVRGEGETHEICSVSDLQVCGKHNVANALAAALACDSLGIGAEVIANGLQVFRSLPGRMELIGEFDGVRFYSDINSTIPSSTLAGLLSLGTGVVLIAGGHSKGTDYADLARYLREMALAVVLLPGSGSDALADLMHGAAVDVVRCVSLREAVTEASRRATHGSAILLSPASASFHSSFVRPTNKTLRALVEELLGQ